MSVDREMRTVQRALAAQGLVVHLVVKDNGYEGHDVWCLVAGPAVDDQQWREWNDEHSNCVAECNRRWREGGDDLNEIQTSWTRAHGAHDWVQRFWESTEGKTYVARRDRFLAPLLAEVGESFEDFLVKHKGMTRVDYKRTTLE